MDPPPGRGQRVHRCSDDIHCLRIYRDTTYRMTINLLTEVSQITREIGLEPADLPHPSKLCPTFDRIEMAVCRTLLHQPAKLHDTGAVGTIDATYFERSSASRSYCDKTRYEVQDLKVTKLVDTETNVVLDLHCTTTREGSDRYLCKQLACRPADGLQILTADRGYDCTWLREYLREELGLRPLIKQGINKPYGHAHNARSDDNLYHQRSMSETVFSSVKRSLGLAL